MLDLAHPLKDTVETTIFLLERDLKDPVVYQELKSRIERRIEAIKESLKEKHSPRECVDLGVLLYGYTSLLKVMLRSSS